MYHRAHNGKGYQNQIYACQVNTLIFEIARKGKQNREVDRDINVNDTSAREAVVLTRKVC